MNTQQSDYFNDDLTYQDILKEIIKQFNATVPSDKEQMYIGYSMKARNIIIQLKQISIIAHKPIDPEYEDAIDKQSLCCEFIYQFREGISQIILECPDLERILHLTKIFSFQKSRIYEIIQLGQNVGQSFIRLRTELKGQKIKKGNNSEQVTIGTIKQENKTIKRHNIHEDGKNSHSMNNNNMKKGQYSFNDIFYETDRLKDKELKSDFVNTLTFNQRQFAKSLKSNKYQEVKGQEQNDDEEEEEMERYQKLINFPLVYLSHDDELPWVLKQIISINQDQVEYLAIDLQRKEEVSLCFCLTKKTTAMQHFSYHFQLQRSMVKGIRQLHAFYIFRSESGESFFVVSREMIGSDLRQVVKEREKREQAYSSHDLLETFRFLVGTLNRIHTQHIYLKNICPTNIVFSSKDQCWKFDNLITCVQINIEEAQSELEKYSDDFYNSGFVDINSLFTDEQQLECFCIETHLAYANHELKHLIKSQYNVFSYYDLQRADLYALGKIFSRILNKMEEIIEIQEIQLQPEGYESKAVKKWNNDQNIVLCRQICEILLSQNLKLNENHISEQVVVSEDRFYIPKSVGSSSKSKFYREIKLARSYQLINWRGKAEEHFKNSIQYFQEKSSENKQELAMLLREISHFYSEYLLDYQEGLQMITEALYQMNQQSSMNIQQKCVIQLDLKYLLFMLGNYKECIEIVIHDNDSIIQQNTYFKYQLSNLDSQAYFKLDQYQIAANILQNALQLFNYFQDTQLDYLFQIQYAEGLQFLGIYQHFAQQHFQAITYLKAAAKIYIKHQLLEDLIDSLSLAAKSELDISNFKNCIATIEICLKHQRYESKKQYLKYIDLLFTASECYRHLNIKAEENRYIAQILSISIIHNIQLDKLPPRIQNILKFEKQIEEMNNNYLPNYKINKYTVLGEYNQLHSKLY